MTPAKPTGTCNCMDELTAVQDTLDTMLVTLNQLSSEYVLMNSNMNIAFTRLSALEAVVYGSNTGSV